MKSARKKHLQEVLSLSSKNMKNTQKPPLTPEIVFISSNLEEVIPRDNDPVIM